MRRWLRIDLAATVLDVVLLLYSSFFLYGAVTGGRSLLAAVGPASGAAVTILLLTVMPFYLGRAWRHLREAYEPLCSTPASVLAVFVYVPTLIFLFAGAIAVGNYSGMLAEHQGVVVGGGLLAVVAGGLLGYLESLLPGDRRGEWATARNKAIVWAALAAAEAPLFVPALAHAPLRGALGGPLAVVTEIAICAAVAAAGWGAVRLFARRGEAIAGWLEASRRAALAGEGLLALVVVTLVCLWYELLVDMLSGGDVGLGGALYIASVTGYLPARALMQLKPPLKPINILTGVGALAVFFWQLLG